MKQSNKLSVRPVRQVAFLLAGSGFCALVYQTVWMRMFRLLFGASTLATSATLAVFMGGLGLGGWLLGRRVEKHPRPLALYSHLELAISLLAGFSVVALEGATWLYHATGGSQTLGAWGSTAMRLVLSVLVMGPSVVLMGATLPAAARAVTRDEDEARGPVAFILGTNTLGAFLGVLATTFLLLEMLGLRTTFLVAVLLNLLVGILARSLDRQVGADNSPVTSSAVAEKEVALSARKVFLLVAAMAVGFAFMLMELVWYRMLGPILGGSTYTLGLVLAVALLGMGLGGLIYALYARASQATLWTLALTCVLEALCLLVPFALGDELALLSLALRPLGGLGFTHLVLSWLAITSIVVFPVAVVAGFQFPLIIALFGRGRDGVGREVGFAYAANTLGSILGALAGGFGLIPAMTAVGVWKGTGAVLLGVGATALILDGVKQQQKLLWRVTTVGVGMVLTLLCMSADGPSAVWRHSAIGAGRAAMPTSLSANGLKEWAREKRSLVFWEKDGVESSVAMSRGPGIAFYVNGKSDGSAFGDAGTQVMGGLIGALLHPNPQNALVVGLGTGSTAGWLAKVPSVQSVDVAEIEPVIWEVAKACQDVNQRVTENQKVQIYWEDARELLMTTRKTYDVVFSEPSNPYRAGIASLYTQEFYEAVKSSLSDNGVLLQWLQAYEVDSSTVRTVLTTLREVFPHVEVWETMGNDLVLRASMKPTTWTVQSLRERIQLEPFPPAIRVAWGSDRLEGVLAHFVADGALADSLKQQQLEEVNTDDRNQVEFAFAKTVGTSRNFRTKDLWGASRAMSADRPSWLSGDLKWEEVVIEGGGVGLLDNVMNDLHLKRRLQLVEGKEGTYQSMTAWQTEPFEIFSVRERIFLSMALADDGDARAMELMKPLASTHTVESLVVTARFHMAKNEQLQAANLILKAFELLHQQVWVHPRVELEATAETVWKELKEKPELAPKWFAALEKPFPAKYLEEARLRWRVATADVVATTQACRVAYNEWEPHTPWRLAYLQNRLKCYTASRDSKSETAQRELDQFMSSEPQMLFWPGQKVESELAGDIAAEAR